MSVLAQALIMFSVMMVITAVTFTFIYLDNFTDWEPRRKKRNDKNDI